MKNILPKFLIPFLFLLLVSSRLYPQDLTSEQIFNKVNDAVVVIISYDENGINTGKGSGFFIDKTTIVSNYHILYENSYLTYSHFGVNKGRLRIIGIDVLRDIILLKTNEENENFLNCSNSDSVIVGKRIYAIGSPMSFENTISEGIISGKRRDFDFFHRDMIQITASITHGSSGGAVVNTKGEVIGISTCGFGEANLNFAIPINYINNISILEFSDFQIDVFNNLWLGLFWGLLSNNPNYKISISYFTKFLNEFQKDAIAYELRGRTYFLGLNQIDMALTDFNKSILLNSNYGIAYYSRGLLFAKTNNYDKAINDFINAINLIRDNPKIYFNRGIVYHELKQTNKAIEDYSKAIELKPDYEDAYLQRGIVYSDTIQYNKAIADFNQVINLNPNNAMAYFNRAIAKYLLGDNSGACQDWKKATDMGYLPAERSLELHCK